MFEVMVTVTGNVISEPELASTRGGVPYAHFRIASTSRRYDRSTGSMTSGDTLYLRVRCWRAMAAAAAEGLSKGTPIVVQGRLVSRGVWEEGADGPVRRGVTEIDATAFGVDLARIPLSGTVSSAA